MFELAAFLYHLINDTKAGIVQWEYVNSWGDGPCALDFREINPVLNELTANDYLASEHWRNVLVANIMDGFVYISQNLNVKSWYTLFVQTDGNAPITRLNFTSDKLSELYELATKQTKVHNIEIITFIDAYINSHFGEDTSIHENN